MTAALRLLVPSFGLVAEAELERALTLRAHVPAALRAVHGRDAHATSDAGANSEMHPMLLARLHDLFPRPAAKNH